MPKPKNFAELFLDQEAKETKVIKKRRMATDLNESDDETSGVVFDEVLSYKPDESAKFSKKIKFTDTEACALKGDKIYLFRVFKKDNVDQISKYRFGFDVSAVNNLMLALDKIKNFYKSNK